MERAKFSISLLLLATTAGTNKPINNLFSELTTMSETISVSPLEYYNVRKRENNERVGFLLSPYSCMKPISAVLLKKERKIIIYLRSMAIYNGIPDLSLIKKHILDSKRLNNLELATLLTVLYKDESAKSFFDGIYSPLDKTIYSLAYKDKEEVKKVIEETMKKTNPEEFLMRLHSLVEELPENLRYPMLAKLEEYLIKIKPPEFAKKEKEKEKKKEKKKEEVKAYE
jgi:hypothetical protein